MLNRITERMIPCVYSYLLSKTKSRGPGWFNSLHHTDDKNIFGSLSNTKSKGSTRDSHGEGSGRKLEMFLLRKRNCIFISFINKR